MNNTSFAIVKEKISQWITDREGEFDNENIKIEIVKDTKECLYIILNFEKCLAAIVVSEPAFAPYHFVSFEAGDIVNNIHKNVYSWYDDEKTAEEEIILNLDNAVRTVVEYCNQP